MFWKKYKTKLSISAVFLAVFLFSNHTYAHSGRTDAYGGHNCYVGSCAGTYHYHNGGYVAPPVYVSPCVEPTLGKNARWDFKSNNCNQDITFSWDKGLLDDFYSIQISKIAGANPGPLSDTSTNSFVFKNIKSGKWYVNVKPGRSCGWGDVRYWTIDVPEVIPKIKFKENIINEEERQLQYTVSCADKIEILPEIGIVKSNNGTILVKPTQDKNYTLTAINKKQTNSFSLTVNFPLSKKEAKQDNTATIKNEESNDSNGASSFLGIMSIPAIIGLVWLLNKSATKGDKKLT